MQTDEDLMLAYAAGDRAAFRELYHRYSARLANVVGRGLRQTEGCKDLLQQVFLQLHRHRRDFDPSRPFRPWLYTIALNVRRQHVRSTRRRPEAELTEPLLATFGREDPSLALHENRQALLLALDNLGPLAQEIIILHWFADLPFVEVAALVGASEAAVKVRAHRAYLAMQAALAAEAPTAGGKVPSSSGNPSRVVA